MSLHGLKELNMQLTKLEAATGEKVLRTALMNASTPAFKAVKAAAPVGKKAHRTHKGRLVAPGFLRRSVIRRSSIIRARRSTIAKVEIGVKSEAFYGVRFVEHGTKPHIIKARRGTKSLMIGRVAVGKKVRHPGAKPNKWMTKTFDSKTGAVISRFSQQLKRKIERAAS